VAATAHRQRQSRGRWPLRRVRDLAGECEHGGVDVLLRSWAADFPGELVVVGGRDYNGTEILLSNIVQYFFFERSLPIYAIYEVHICH
jgi:hypothetical protein